MKRKQFLKKLGIGIIAATLLPALVIPQIKKTLRITHTFNTPVKWGEINGITVGQFQIHMKVTGEPEEVKKFETLMYKLKT